MKGLCKLHLGIEWPQSRALTSLLIYALAIVKPHSFFPSLSTALSLPPSLTPSFLSPLAPTCLLPPLINYKIAAAAISIAIATLCAAANNITKKNGKIPLLQQCLLPRLRIRRNCRWRETKSFKWNVPKFGGVSTHCVCVSVCRFN